MSEAVRRKNKYTRKIEPREGLAAARASDHNGRHTSPHIHAAPAQATQWSTITSTSYSCILCVKRRAAIGSCDKTVAVHRLPLLQVRLGKRTGATAGHLHLHIPTTVPIDCGHAGVHQTQQCDSSRQI